MADLGARLPLVNKLLYASDMVGSQTVANTRSLWLLFFLAPPATSGLPTLVPALDLGILRMDPRVFAGVLLTVGRVVEAFDDPLIGWWSDRFKSRWGRRIPFVLFSTPFYAIFFALLWFTPGGDAGVVSAVYVFLVVELFFLANTFSAGPYEAILPEIARSHHDRMSLVAWQLYFGLIGVVLGLGLSGIVKDVFDFKVMGITAAVFGIVFRYVGLWGIWRKAPRETPAAQLSLWLAFSSTLRNKQFLYFLPTFVLYQTAVGMVIAWLPFFVPAAIGEIQVWRWVPAFGDQTLGPGSLTSILGLAAVLGIAVGALILWKLSNTKTKRWVYRISLLGTAIYLPGLFFAGFIPVVPKLIQGMGMAFLAGIPMAGVNLLPKAITADITDYDEMRTGMRREAMFYATQNLFEKIGSSLAPLLLGVILLLGDSTDDSLGIRVMGPVAGLIVFIGFWLFQGYRLPSTVTRENVKAAGL